MAFVWTVMPTVWFWSARAGKDGSISNSIAVVSSVKVKLLLTVTVIAVLLAPRVTVFEVVGPSIVAAAGVCVVTLVGYEPAGLPLVRPASSM